MKNRFDVLVFDWDGTLFDSVAWIVHCLQRAAEDAGVDIPAESTAKSVIGLGLREAVEILCPGADADTIHSLAAHYRRHYSSRPTTAADLFEGVPEMLITFRERGYQLAVATGKNRAGLDHALKATGIEDLFHITRCADETASKPDPTMLVEIMSALSAAPSRTLMIGDSLHDLRMAHNAGIPAIGVGHGANSLDELAALNPLLCLPTTCELLNLLV